MADVGVVAPLLLSQQRQHAVRGDWNQCRSYDNSAVLRRAGAAVDGPDVDANFTSGVREEVVGDAFERVDEARQNARFGRVSKGLAAATPGRSVVPAEKRKAGNASDATLSAALLLAAFRNWMTTRALLTRQTRRRCVHAVSSSPESCTDTTAVAVQPF